jgi:nucleoside 2-deoxyribosyltransferase
MVDEALRAFISGTVSDLREYRQAALDACLRVGVTPVGVESFETPGEGTVSAAVATAIHESDIYLAIVSPRYGASFSEEGKSITEIEYDLAAKRGIPSLVFVKREARHLLFEEDAAEATSRVQSFAKTVRRSGLVTEFRSVDDFKSQVITALVDVVDSLSHKSEPQSVLLLVPIGERQNALRHFLAETLQELGLVVYRIEDASPGAPSANAMTTALGRADILIADVTDANPNIMYELGYAHSLRKPTILLAESSSMRSVPSDLMGNRVLTYEGDDLDALRRPIARLIQEFTKEKWRR